MGIRCNVCYNEERRKIVAELPITLPTSSVRVKDIWGDPIGSVRSQNLSGEWYAECQISYFDESRQLVELGEMFRLLVTKSKVVNEKELRALYHHLKDRDVFFEETFSSSTEKDGKAEKFEGFTLLHRKTPILRKQLSDGSFIHIELRHKQKAVGYQAMLYIFIPIKGSAPFLGQPAEIIWLG